MSEHVIVTEANKILTVQLNRPEKRNALTQAMYATMTQALQDANARDDIAAVVFSGAGDLFCAGNDLGDFLRHGELKPDSPVFQFLQTISTVDVTVVAAVQGAAVGIGTTLLLHCDLVYAAEGTKFVMPFVDMGLVPEAASSQLLPALCGHLKAAELLLLAETIDAQKAYEFNMVNQVVPASELAATIADVSARLAAKPVRSLRLSKKLMKVQPEAVPARIQRELKYFLTVLASAETQQIIAAKAQRK
ncbi:enoyl-CoA hydratase-related protein [Aliidiomarina haloalkalitolerans]|uniref:Enoyl-CoA hydratase n=1 Tax=Aliidiomarina haloalkalitolerans TaxID=859059 RepID=A0A432VZH1_9GAMM|nr:enoyl-CoA hydratase-related protein [Aliidiomarina haloalkalitolerans]RUO22061.1 enoyl-CoA hydratase [Aliidiomarina haloalkalitolerans]